MSAFFRPRECRVGHAKRLLDFVIRRFVEMGELELGAGVFKRLEQSGGGARTERLGGFFSYTRSRSDTRVATVTKESLGDRTHLLFLMLTSAVGGVSPVCILFESGRPYTVA